MIATSTTATVPFKAQWREDEPAAPEFQLRAGSIIERSRMEGDLAGKHRAGKVMGFELRAAVISGVQTLLADDPELDTLIELINREGDDAASLDDAERQLLRQVNSILRENWPEYSELIAQMERRRQIAPMVALQYFCTGIDGVGRDGKPIAFARDRLGNIADATLRNIDELELLVAGNRAFALQYADGQEGNSPRPASSENGPQTSSSDGMSKEDGKSTGGPGRKTPGSRSRPKSGRR